MKASPKKLLPLILFGIAVTSLFSVQPVQAYIVTLDQVGANVVATGSGPINLMGLTFNGSFFSSNQAAVTGGGGIIQTGPTGFVSADLYSGFSGPASFGTGGVFFANTGSGDFVGIDGTGSLVVPHGYVSGAALSDSMTFDNATIHSLGLTPGTYVWTWGSGLPNQNFTLIIGRAGVPDGGSTVSLLGCALLGLAALRHKLGC
jgi:hypothetical protein